MSIFRSIRRIIDCPTCGGSGRVFTKPDRSEEGPCDACGGDGKIEVLSRASRTAVHAAEQATKSLPPRERKAAKARLQNQEALAGAGAEGNVGKEGFIEEE